MTTYTLARDSLVEVINSAWQEVYPLVPVIYDNAAPTDYDNLEEFLGCEIAFSNSKQREFGPTPTLRVYGSITFVIACKVSKGYRASLLKADFLSDLVRFKKQNGVVLQAPFLLPPVERNGWYFVEVTTPFFFDN